MFPGHYVAFQAGVCPLPLTLRASPSQRQQLISMRRLNHHEDGKPSDYINSIVEDAWRDEIRVINQALTLCQRLSIQCCHINKKDIFSVACRGKLRQNDMGVLPTIKTNQKEQPSNGRTYINTYQSILMIQYCIARILIKQISVLQNVTVHKNTRTFFNLFFFNSIYGLG